MYQPEFDPHKMRELVLLIANHSREDQPIHTNKIGIMMYYSDTRAYRKIGAAISGATYRNMLAGPQPSEYAQQQHNMHQHGDITITTDLSIMNVQQYISPNRTAKLNVFTPEQLVIINDVVDQYGHLSLEDVSETARKEIGYRTMKPYENIPYYMSWFSPKPLTQEQIALGQSIWRQNQATATL